MINSHSRESPTHSTFGLRSVVDSQMNNRSNLSNYSPRLTKTRFNSINSLGKTGCCLRHEEKKGRSQLAATSRLLSHHDHPIYSPSHLNIFCLLFKNLHISHFHHPLAECNAIHSSTTKKRKSEMQILLRCEWDEDASLQAADLCISCLIRLVQPRKGLYLS